MLCPGLFEKVAYASVELDNDGVRVGVDARAQQRVPLLDEPVDVVVKVGQGRRRLHVTAHASEHASAAAVCRSQIAVQIRHARCVSQVELRGRPLM